MRALKFTFYSGVGAMEGFNFGSIPSLSEQHWDWKVIQDRIREADIVPEKPATI